MVRTSQLEHAEEPSLREFQHHPKPKKTVAFKSPHHSQPRSGKKPHHEPTAPAPNPVADHTVKRKEGRYFRGRAYRKFITDYSRSWKKGENKSTLAFAPLVRRIRDCFCNRDDEKPLRISKKALVLIHQSTESFLKKVIRRASEHSYSLGKRIYLTPDVLNYTIENDDGISPFLSF